MKRIYSQCPEGQPPGEKRMRDYRHQYERVAVKEEPVVRPQAKGISEIRATEAGRNKRQGGLVASRRRKIAEEGKG